MSSSAGLPSPAPPGGSAQASAPIFSAAGGFRPGGSRSAPWAALHPFRAAPPWRGSPAVAPSPPPAVDCSAPSSSAPSGLGPLAAAAAAGHAWLCPPSASGLSLVGICPRRNRPAYHTASGGPTPPLALPFSRTMAGGTLLTVVSDKQERDKGIGGSLLCAPGDSTQEVAASLFLVSFSDFSLDH